MTSTAKQKKQKLPAKEWVPYCEKANILADALSECKSEHGKSIKLGQFLSPMVGREVRIMVGERTGKAVLRVEQDRAKAKVYYFEVTWDDPPTESEQPKVKAGKKPTKTGKSKSAKAPSNGKKSKMPPKALDKKQGKSQRPDAPAGGKKQKTRPKTVGNAEDWG